LGEGIKGNVQERAMPVKNLKLPMKRREGVEALLYRRIKAGKGGRRGRGG